MNTYIALLRGINVGGHRKTPMAELRELLTKKGLKNVQTYIQSGNVVFQSSTNNKTKIEELIKKSILNHFGFEVPTLVKANAEIQSVLDSCPFSGEKKLKSYFFMLRAIPKQENVKEVYLKQYEGEEYVIFKDCIYYYPEKGYGKAKFNMNFFEKKLETDITSRNYRTMNKLLEMSTV